LFFTPLGGIEKEGQDFRSKALI